MRITEREVTFGVTCRFLKCLSIFNLKNKTLASHLDLKESNLSAVLNGKRRMNIDLALKLEQYFGIEAEIWLGIQMKNEVSAAREKAEGKYSRYKQPG